MSLLSSGVSRSPKGKGIRVDFMVRPIKFRYCRCRPCACYYKPRGIPMRLLQEVEIAPDELEALKLHDSDGLDQTAAAAAMNISQPTFNRILNRVHKKIARALVNGQAIKINQTV